MNGGPRRLDPHDLAPEDVLERIDAADEVERLRFRVKAMENERVEAEERHADESARLRVDRDYVLGKCIEARTALAALVADLRVLCSDEERKQCSPDALLNTSTVRALLDRYDADA